MDNRAVLAGAPFVVAAAVIGWQLGEAQADAAIEDGAGPLAVLAMPYGSTIAISAAVALVAICARSARWFTAMLAWALATPACVVLADVASADDSDGGVVQLMLVALGFTLLPAAISAGIGAALGHGLGRLGRGSRLT